MGIYEFRSIYSTESTIMKLLAMAATVAFLVWYAIPAQAHTRIVAHHDGRHAGHRHRNRVAGRRHVRGEGDPGPGP